MAEATMDKEEDYLDSFREDLNRRAIDSIRSYSPTTNRRCPVSIPTDNTCNTIFLR
jgi:hypothetical protein